MTRNVFCQDRRAFCGALLTLAASQALATPALRWRPVFAVVPYLPARRLVELYAPLLPVWTRVLGREPEFTSAPHYGEHLRRMRAGDYDIVADSLLLARIAQRELGHLPIARTAAPLEPMLVVPQGHGIARLTDLKGKAVAVTDRSAALSVIGLRYLRDQGVVPGRDVAVVVTGSHANSLHRLLAGEVAAAVVSQTTLMQVDAALAARVRELARLPRGLAAVIYHVAPRLAPQATALERALLEFATTLEGRAFLDALGHQGLLPVSAREMATLDPLVVELYRQQASE